MTPARARPDHVAGHQRRPGHHRRGDGAHPVPDVVLLDHPRIPGPRAPGCSTPTSTRCASRSRLPCTSARCPAISPGSRRRLQGGKWNDGDVVIHNHPYHGSSHSPDIAIVIPVFHKGQLVAYSANTAHHLDIGAATPGSHHRHSRTSTPRACCSRAPSSTRSRPCATRRCGTTSGATAAPHASSRTTSTPRSRRRGSGCAASTSCWTATGWTPC